MVQSQVSCGFSLQPRQSGALPPLPNSQVQLGCKRSCGSNTPPIFWHPKCDWLRGLSWSVHKNTWVPQNIPKPNGASVHRQLSPRKSAIWGHTHSRIIWFIIQSGLYKPRTSSTSLVLSHSPRIPRSPGATVIACGSQRQSVQLPDPEAEDLVALVMGWIVGSLLIVIVNNG